jgi:uncharacterized protein YecE (DUF72 family)
MDIRIGTAGWSVPKSIAARFPAGGTHLQRYARGLNAAEINTSFYRPHKPETYARWAASVPDGFRFAVKIPREITHTRKLASATAPFTTFLDQAQALGDRLGPLLVQLPPSLRYDARRVRAFFNMMRARFDGDVACEPRHVSWFTDGVDDMLQGFRIARVAADPAVTPRAAVPGGWPGLIYQRLHGAPKMYYSAYSAGALKLIARDIRRATPAYWCIFDNTASGAAIENAFALDRIVHDRAV